LERLVPKILAPPARVLYLNFLSDQSGLYNRFHPYHIQLTISRALFIEKQADGITLKMGI
jgi:hypothetical protein